MGVGLGNGVGDRSGDTAHADSERRPSRPRPDDLIIAFTADKYCLSNRFVEDSSGRCIHKSALKNGFTLKVCYDTLRNKVLTKTLYFKKAILHFLQQSRG